MTKTKLKKADQVIMSGPRGWRGPQLIQINRKQFITGEPLIMYVVQYNGMDTTCHLTNFCHAEHYFKQLVDAEGPVEE